MDTAGAFVLGSVVGLVLGVLLAWVVRRLSANPIRWEWEDDDGPDDDDLIRRHSEDDFSRG